MRDPRFGRFVGFGDRARVLEVVSYLAALIRLPAHSTCSSAPLEAGTNAPRPWERVSGAPSGT
jgi:hypothetical protein